MIRILCLQIFHHLQGTQFLGLIDVLHHVGVDLRLFVDILPVLGRIITFLYVDLCFL